MLFTTRRKPETKQSLHALYDEPLKRFLVGVAKRRASYEGISLALRNLVLQTVRLKAGGGARLPSHQMPSLRMGGAIPPPILYFLYDRDKDACLFTSTTINM